MLTTITRIFGNAVLSYLGVLLIKLLQVSQLPSERETVAAGVDLGGGCRGCAPPPRDDLRFSNTTGILQKQQQQQQQQKTMWFIGVEVEQETSAPSPKKKSWIRP